MKTETSPIRPIEPRAPARRGRPVRPSGFDPTAITRPDPILMRYYFLLSLLSLIAFPIVVLRLYFRYITLRYRFDEEGIHLSWGVLFRKEVNLTYRRIQDIHVTRNILQRWMGLANVEVQTASGSASAEMTIEGILDPDALRDYLYVKMRGARGDEDVAPSEAPPAASETAATAPAATADDEALALLRGIHEEVVALRRAIESRPGEGGDRHDR